MTIGEENEWVIGMKRYEKMSKEEIMEAFRVTIDDIPCNDCIVGNSKRDEACSCGEVIYKYLTEEVKVEKKRRCDIYTEEEIKEIAKVCEKHNAVLQLPDFIYCTDNAAMIASAGYFEYINGTRHGLDLNAVPSLKL